MSFGSKPHLVADEMISAHGVQARQKVVDRIVIALRLHDLPTAKRWDAIGQAVDEKLIAANDDAARQPRDRNGRAE